MFHITRYEVLHLARGGRLHPLSMQIASSENCALRLDCRSLICPRKRSGSMLAERAPPRPTTLEIRRRRLASPGGIKAIQALQLTRSVESCRIIGDFMICMATCWNCALIGIRVAGICPATTLMGRRLGRTVVIAAVVGSSTRATARRRIAVGSRRRSRTTSWASASSGHGRNKSKQP